MTEDRSEREIFVRIAGRFSQRRQEFGLNERWDVVLLKAEE
jgi:hypothetical protein